MACRDQVDRQSKFDNCTPVMVYFHSPCVMQLPAMLPRAMARLSASVPSALGSSRQRRRLPLTKMGPAHAKRFSGWPKRRG